MLIVGLWLGFAFSVRHRVVFSLQTLSNLLAAMREEDFSVRRARASRDDAMGEVNDRGELAERNASRAAAWRTGSHCVAAHGDGRNRTSPFFTFDNENKHAW